MNISEFIAKWEPKLKFDSAETHGKIVREFEEDLMRLVGISKKIIEGKRDVIRNNRITDNRSGSDYGL